MIRRILNILYSLWFNLRYLPFAQAVRMPVLIRTNMRIKKLRRGQINSSDQTAAYGTLQVELKLAA